MKAVVFATSSVIKYSVAWHVLAKSNINLVREDLDVPEIQGEEGEVIARDKAEKAFQKLGKPVIITDDTWMIPGLNNFPGPYMKSMNEWLTPEDWLRLTDTLADRRIILRQFAVYQDANLQKVFIGDVEGILLHEIRGKSKHPHCTIISFDDGKHSDAEFHEQGLSGTKDSRTVWDEIGPWLEKHLTS